MNSSQHKNKLVVHSRFHSALLLIKMFTLVTLLKCFYVVKMKQEIKKFHRPFEKSDVVQKLEKNERGGKKFMNIFALQLLSPPFCSVALCDALL